MRDEDLDWKIYHIIVAKVNCPLSCLLDMSGTDKEAVLSSLKRLEKNCLIETNDNSARILSLEETIIRNSIRTQTMAPDSPVIIENGIIKQNPNYKGKF